MSTSSVKTDDDQLVRATIAVRTAKELLDILSPNNDRWRSTYRLGWIFRGSGNAAHELIPKAWRPKEREILKGILSRDIFGEVWPVDQLRTYIGDTAKEPAYLENAREAVQQAYLEHAVAADFWEIADEIGISAPTPKSDHYWAEDIQALCREPPTATFEAYDLLALAQHHGVATRLLDWTTNPIAAAYFAANSFDEAGEAEHVAVYALSTSGPHNLGGGLRIFRSPRSATPYMVAQRGCFTWIHGAELFFARNGRWPSVDDAITEGLRAHQEHLNDMKGFHDRFGNEIPQFDFWKEKGAPLVEFRLPVSEIGDLVARLWRFDMTRAHLMPTLDNVAACLRQRWKISADPIGQLAKTLMAPTAPSEKS